MAPRRRMDPRPHNPEGPPPPAPASVPEPLVDFVGDLREALGDTTQQESSAPIGSYPPVISQHTTHWISAGWHRCEGWDNWYWYDGGHFELDYQPYWYPGGPLGYQQASVQYIASPQQQQQRQSQQSSAPTRPPQHQSAPSGSQHADPSGRTEDQEDGSGSAGVGGERRIGGAFPLHPRTWRGG